MVDILPHEEATRHIPRRFLDAGRVLYYCALPEEIVGIARFEFLVASRWPGATLLHLVKMIITPPCTPSRRPPVSSTVTASLATPPARTV